MNLCAEIALENPAFPKGTGGSGSAPWAASEGTPGDARLGFSPALWVVLGFKHQQRETINPGDSNNKGKPSFLGLSTDLGIFPMIQSALGQSRGSASSSSPLEPVGSLPDPEGTGMVRAWLSFLRLHPPPCRALLSPLEQPGRGFSFSSPTPPQGMSCKAEL